MLASEYGWTAEKILDLPMDQTPQYIHAILVRKGVRVFRSGGPSEAPGGLSERVKSIFQSIDTSD